MIKKKILILGASGFIGYNCLKHFSKNDNYIVSGTYYKNKPRNIKGVKLNRLDLTNKKNNNDIFKGIDILIQAAATTSGAKDIISKPYMHVNDNAIMNSFITKIAYDNKIKHVIIFSCTVMYKSSRRPLKETDFDPNDEMYEKYFGAGWMKVFVEKMSEFYSRFKINKYTLIRHTNIYGPYDKFDLEKSHVFGATINKVINNKTGFIDVWGDGKEKRNFLYISDLIKFIDLVIKKQKSFFEIYNLGSSISVSISQLVKNIINVSGKNINIKFLKAKPTLKTDIIIDSSKARKELGWKPEISLQQGIKKTILWYKKNIL
jgi:GDP-L-fucose synthase